MKKEKFEPCNRCKKNNKINKIIDIKNYMIYIYFFFTMVMIFSYVVESTNTMIVSGFMVLLYAIGLIDQNNRLYKLFHYKELLKKKCLITKRLLCYTCEYKKTKQDLIESTHLTYVMIIGGLVYGLIGIILHYTNYPNLVSQAVLVVIGVLLILSGFVLLIILDNRYKKNEKNFVSNEIKHGEKQ